MSIQNLEPRDHDGIVPLITALNYGNVHAAAFLAAYCLAVDFVLSDSDSDVTVTQMLSSTIELVEKHEFSKGALLVGNLIESLNRYPISFPHCVCYIDSAEVPQAILGGKFRLVEGFEGAIFLLQRTY